MYAGNSVVDFVAAEFKRAVGGLEGVLILHRLSRNTIAYPQCRDGACRLITDQADIACARREAP